MKKLLVLILASVCLLSSFGCSSQNDISKYLKKKDGEQYLILPISKKEVSVSSWHDSAKYIKRIDVGLLKAAERKISAEASQYDDDLYFFLDIHDGYLCLCTEVIVKFDTPDENGMDHEHVFFRERITKKPVQKSDDQK